ncbi:alcohol dehydrogenase catalytic domain-containing protein [Streptomyces sp. HNM0575]|uniref:alcohol dehydrogenase catalytic domain-containing protein n=1 Tax=Streptomyces sp. HNM0575 TaxID=2716338 RepID=UPI00145C8F2E|nr:alcohol dehydrogenase catalytic domain-containing protein [Streptomyces sp. HNM0575]NLU74019.1 alcohol dehydrogenase catalytic domain-containing protein [Streptomyces sp. HNM0575]
MRAVRLYGREDIRIEDVPLPRPGPGEVAVRVLYNGLCGSDVHEYFDGPIGAGSRPHPVTGAHLPSILGHELSGEVAESGEGVADLAPGERVAVMPMQSCGRCPDCLRGRHNVCPQLAIHGFNRVGGGLSEVTVVRRDMVFPLPPALSAAHGALVEPMAVSYRAARRVHAEQGDLVVVFGAGPIGLGAVIALRARGVDTLVSEPSALRRTAAELVGATHVIDPANTDAVAAARDLTDGWGAAGAMDAAGDPGVVGPLMECCRTGGHAVIAAVHTRPLRVSRNALVRREVDLSGSMTYDKGDYEAVIADMAAGAYPVDGWVETIEFEDVVERGLHALRRQEANKLLVRVAGDAPRLGGRGADGTP